MDGALNYALTLATRGFTGPLNAASGGVRSFTSSIARVAAPLAAAAAGMGVLGAAMAGVMKAAKFEQLQVGMKNLLGSKEAANALFRELREFEKVAGAFTLMDDLAPAARKLVNAGVAAKEVVTELTAIGNVASASGASLDSVVSAYTKAMITGKTSGEVLQQMGDAGIKIHQMLADAIDEPKEKIAQLAERGLLSGELLRAAFYDAGGAAGALGKAMEEASQTSLGKWSNIKGVIDQILLTLGAPINDAIKPVLDEALRLVGQLEPAAARMGKSLADNLTIGFQALKDGSIGTLVGQSLSVAGMNFANHLALGMRTQIGMVAEFTNVMADGIGAVTKVFEAGGLRAAKAIIDYLGDGMGQRLTDIISGSGLPGSKSLAAGIAGVLHGAKNKDQSDPGIKAEAEGRSRLADVFDRLAKGLDPFSAEQLAKADAALAETRSRLATAAEENRKATQAQTVITEDITAEQKAAWLAVKAATKAAIAAPKGPAAAAAAAAAGAGVAGPAGVAGQAGVPRRRGLLNAADSAAARAGRRSAADKRGSALDTLRPAADVAFREDLVRRGLGFVGGPEGGAKFGDAFGNRGARPIGRRAREAAADAARQAGGAAAGAAGAAQPGGKRPDDHFGKMTEFLRAIAGNTEVLKALGVA
jgi:hypothetical protein